VRLIDFCAFAVVMATASAACAAQQPAGFASFPSKPVRMIIPLAPGGGSDIVGRIVALALADKWHQALVVDNRPGGGSTVGTALAAKAAPDGYTLLVSSSSIAISPALYRNLPFDIRRDFANVTLIASQPSILAVSASVQASSARDLIALAKASPGKLAYGSAGAGSATHLGSELFKYLSGADILHVPYKSAGLATAALLSGEVQVLLTNMASVLPHAKTGRLRILGITSTKRSPAAPDVPTIAESGLPAYEYSTWYAMLVPAGTPAALVDRLHKDVSAVMKSQTMLDRLHAQGLDVHALSPAQTKAHVDAEITKWDKVIKAANIKVD
jgi:tripartite-type tricarboxylate transporter receptor subunit TctC